jgi:iron(III) transport system substrate-binding protein
MMFPRARATYAALASLSALGLALTACSSSGTASAGQATNSAATGAPTTQASNSALSAVCQKGQSEGEVDYFTEQDPSIFAKEAKPFEAQYPGIKVKITQLEPQDQVSRVLTEIQAHHKLDADVLAGDPESDLPLFKGGDIQPVDLTKYGVPANLGVQILGTTVFVTQRVFHGIGYNTKQYKASDIPDTWQGLVDPKLAGKISVDPRGKWIAPLVTNSNWGPTKTFSWYQDLLKTDKPQVVKGVTDSLTKVVSGEVPITTSARSAEVEQLAAGGAPVAIKYLDVVPVDEVVVPLLKNAPHPNAATCFMAWLTGPVSQAQQFKYEFKTNGPTPKGMPANATLTNDLTEQNINEIAAIETKMSAITK